MKDGVSAIWATPKEIPAPDESKGRGAEDIETWRRLSDRVAELAAARDWSKSEVARRCGMPSGTFSQWHSGTYSGRYDAQNSVVESWLETVEADEDFAASIPASPGFAATRSAGKIIDALAFAQMSPALIVVTYGAGMGKTTACARYRATRPHVHMFTASPHVRTVHGMLVEIAAEIGLEARNPSRLSRAVRERLRRAGSGTLLIADEAQNLGDDAVNQLRQLVDLAGCGVALVGNGELYGRFHRSGDGPSYAQIRRRVALRLAREYPWPEDIDAIVAAWGIDDPACKKVLKGIGMKPGALGQIDVTLKMASMLAAGAGTKLTADLIRMAWSNRDVGGQS